MPEEAHDEYSEQVTIQAPKEFTEIFSWGSDRHGQLGLGQEIADNKINHDLPKLCSYNIPIAQVSCGMKHTAFITSKSLAD